MAKLSIEERRTRNRQSYYANRQKCLERAKRYRDSHKEQIKAYHKKDRLKRRYGLTEEQFKQMLTSQNSQCAICSNTFKDRKDTHIDHNHKTGQVRQILCRKCNLRMGLFNEDINELTKTIQYLLKWNN